MINDILLFGSNETTRHLPEGLSKALIGFHSGWRYIIIILMLLGIWFGYQTSKGKKPFAGSTRKMGMFTMIAVDIQLVVGLVLYFYFLSRYTNLQINKLKGQMGAPEFRSIAVDHVVGMMIALILIHIGYSKAKKATTDISAGKKQFTYFLIAFIIILISIPWPFLDVNKSRGWF